MHSNSAAIASNLQAFSSPYEDMSTKFLDLILAEYGRLVLRRFLTDSRPALERSEGLVDLLSQLSEDPAVSSDQYWQPSLGDMRTVSRASDPSRAGIVAAQFALSCHAKGYAGEWRFLGLPASIRFQFGELLLPPTQRLSVEIHDPTAAIHVCYDRHNSHLHLSSKQSINVAAGEQPRVLPTVQIGSSRLVFLPRSAFADDGAPNELVDSLSQIEEGMSPDLMRAYEIASSMLASVPRYEEWVSRVVRRVVPLVFNGQTLISGSNARFSGVISVSNSPDPAALAETLVHEASHQYFYILSYLGPVDDGTDENLYYSPVRQQERPISAILVAYHAFANVLLWSDECLEHGSSGEEYHRKNIAEIPGVLQSLERGLSATNALTARGHVLWKPLQELVSKFY